MIVNAYAAPSATEPLVPTTIERRDVGTRFGESKREPLPQPARRASDKRDPAV